MKEEMSLVGGTSWEVSQTKGGSFAYARTDIGMALFLILLLLHVSPGAPRRRGREPPGRGTSGASGCMLLLLLVG